MDIILDFEIFNAEVEADGEQDSFLRMGSFSDVKAAVNAILNFEFTETDCNHYTHGVLSIKHAGIRTHSHDYKWFELNKQTRRCIECGNPFSELCKQPDAIDISVEE